MSVLAAILTDVGTFRHPPSRGYLPMTAFAALPQSMSLGRTPAKGTLLHFPSDCNLALQMRRLKAQVDQQRS